MQRQNALPWVLVALVALAVMLYLYFKKQAQNQAAANADIGNPIARGARYVTNRSESVLDRIPIVGHTISQMFNAPVQNVTSGDWKKTTTSIFTGGVSDVLSGWL